MTHHDGSPGDHDPADAAENDLDAEVSKLDADDEKDVNKALADHDIPSLPVAEPTDGNAPLP